MTGAHGPRVSLRERAEAMRPEGGEVVRLLRLARGHLTEITAALVLSTGATLATLAAPQALAKLTDDVLAPGLATTTALHQLNRISMLLLALFAVRAVLGAAQVYLMARAGEGIVLELRQALFNNLTRLGPAFYDQRRIGELISRLLGDVGQVQGVLTTGVSDFVQSGLVLIGAFAILLYQSWVLTAAIALVVPPVVLMARTYGRQQHRLGLDVQDRAADTASVAEETLGAIRLVQIFEREPEAQRRFHEAASGMRNAAMARAASTSRYGPVVSFLMLGAVVVVLWVGGIEVLHGTLAMGDLVAFVVYGGMIGTAGSRLVALSGQWAAGLGATRRVFEWLETEPAVVDRPDALTPERAEGWVALEGVRFAYRPGDEVLKGIDLEVAPGETLALVGQTGAGKSTIMYLIARAYDPTAGRVTLDGVDVRALSLHGLRRWLAAVPQETVLFNATVEENLRFGRQDATMAEIREAAAAAFADEFVERLPEGYQTIVGERGVRLSAGQRQRIAIARALLRDPRVLLLDEATSSLDTASERIVQQALNRLMVGRTTIVVAHRLSTVHRAHCIAVIDRGLVAERGTHDELLAAGGLYAHLYELQFEDGAQGEAEMREALRHP